MSQREDLYDCLAGQRHLICHHHSIDETEWEFEGVRILSLSIICEIANFGG